MKLFSIVEFGNLFYNLYGTDRKVLYVIIPTYTTLTFLLVLLWILHEKLVKKLQLFQFLLQLTLIHSTSDSNYDLFSTHFNQICHTVVVAK